MSYFIKFLKKYHKIYRNFCKQRRIKDYLKHGQRPWSKGYSDFKWQLIGQNINNSDLINKFKNNSELPEFYGRGIDERIIEYPWILANLPDTGENLLDAGSALNFEKILNYAKFNNKKITIVNLASEGECFLQKASYVFADLRKLPFLDNYFDVITCISTLEHVGMDNTMIYTYDKKYKENKQEDYLKAVLELKRVLRPGGVLLISVPFGKYQSLQFFQQFNQDMVNQIIKTFNGQAPVIGYYKYFQDGWNISNAEECKNMEYFDIHQVRTKNKDYDSDLAAAARAVACIQLIK